LFLRTSSSDTQKLGAAGKIAALAFSSSGSDAVVADSGAQEVLLVRAGALELLAGEQDGILNPAAVAFSPRGVLVANEGTKSVGLLPSDRGVPQYIACECTPKLLNTLSPGVFQLTENGDGPVWIFDIRPEEAKLWFIPAKVAEPEGER
jgi:hypothetical protein